MLPSDLGMMWRIKANELRDGFGAEGQARGIEWCIGQLEQALQAQEKRLLNLQEAADLSGYSADHLGRLVREGRIPNAGRPGAPRIAQGDLPSKPKVLAVRCSESETNNAEIVQSIIERGTG